MIDPSTAATETLAAKRRSVSVGRTTENQRDADDLGRYLQIGGVLALAS